MYTNVHKLSLQFETQCFSVHEDKDDNYYAIIIIMIVVVVMIIIIIIIIININSWYFVKDCVF